jgi:hypothetical protein
VSDSFPIQNGLKPGGLKLNGIYQLLAYVDDVKPLGDNIDSIKKNTETLIDASKEVGIEMNVEKTKYMLLSHHWNAGQSRGMEIENRSFESVSQFKSLGITLTNQNLIQEEIKRRLNSVYACYIRSSRLLLKNKILNMPVVLYGCETWSLTLS